MSSLLAVSSDVTRAPRWEQEMQNMQMPKYDVPELSEVMASLFKGSGSAGPSSTRSSAVARVSGKRKA